MRAQRVYGSLGIPTIALVLLLGLTGVGCDDLSSTDESATTLIEGTSSTEAGVSSTEVPSSVTTAAPATTPTTQALSSAETLLPNGHIKAAGIIDDAWQDASGRHLRIDYIDVLTWDEAVAAGMEDPAYPYDGFWYSNVNPMLREFDVSTSAEILTSYRNYHVDFETTCTWADFMSFWSPSPAPGDEYMHDQIWWIERDGSTIIWIYQQYTS